MREINFKAFGWRKELYFYIIKVSIYVNSTLKVKFRINQKRCYRFGVSKQFSQFKQHLLEIDKNWQEVAKTLLDSIKWFLQIM